MAAQAGINVDVRDALKGGPAYSGADGYQGSYLGQNYQGGFGGYYAPFSPGGSGAFASASGESSIWKWLIFGGVALFAYRVWKG
ncbi:MAG: hypothetical protein CMM42_17595 [Rhodospirillaceae bacterium]|nr:hypothetical protein [Rhodospirillaceae bacterium]